MLASQWMAAKPSTDELAGMISKLRGVGILLCKILSIQGVELGISPNLYWSVRAAETAYNLVGIRVGRVISMYS